MERFYIWAAAHQVEVFTVVGLFAAWAVKGYRDYTSNIKRPRFERAISNFMCSLLLLVFVVPALEYLEIKPALIPFIGAAFGAIGTESLILLTSKLFNQILNSKIPHVTQSITQTETKKTTPSAPQRTRGYIVPEPPMPKDGR